MIRVFNGGLWHGGDANNTGTGVWKLFLGLVPGNHPTAGDFPLFEDDAGKSLGRILILHIVKYMLFIALV
jgi:hypothetical protein